MFAGCHRATVAAGPGVPRTRTPLTPSNERQMTLSVDRLDFQSLSRPSIDASGSDPSALSKHLQLHSFPPWCKFAEPRPAPQCRQRRRHHCACVACASSHRHGGASKISGPQTLRQKEFAGLCCDATLARAGVSRRHPAPPTVVESVALLSTCNGAITGWLRCCGSLERPACKPRAQRRRPGAAGAGCSARADSPRRVPGGGAGYHIPPARAESGTPRGG